ncbi:YacL family protein [Neptunomonas antarctica]|uniref:Uncharacterized protein n=1 Tax=Neptunomonas antarctica TaxID=619304 RepID=A0A1N7KBX6_9GAMM|nr:YacL family protein [Neptunomonas antarctica]SIS59091.1 hypothetical protein SAMN05421760_102322 [Neptunomonas antarctica]
MDYEFTVDDIGRPVAKFSMGAEAIGRWMSEEIRANQHEIDTLLGIIEQLEQRMIGQHQQRGSEFQLRLNQYEIEVLALVLDLDMDDELPEETNLYDEESYAGCGLQDFKEALLSWREFVGE